MLIFLIVFLIIILVLKKEFILEHKFLIFLVAICAFLFIIPTFYSVSSTRRLTNYSLPIIIIGFIAYKIFKKYISLGQAKQADMEQRIYDVLYEAHYKKDISILNQLTETERKNPFFQMKVQSMSEIELYDKVLDFTSHYRIFEPVTFEDIAIELEFWNSIPELEKCYNPFIKNAREIASLSKGLFHNMSTPQELQNRIKTIAVDSKYLLSIKEGLPLLIKQEECLDDISRNVNTYHIIEDEPQIKDYTQIYRWLSIVTGTIHDKSIIPLIPSTLIYLAQIDERTKKIIEYENHLYKLYELYYQPWSRKNNTWDYYPMPSADYLIMKSLIYMRGNVIESINEELKKYLYPDEDLVYNDKYFENGYLVLQKFYEAYGLHEQEKLVLSAMLERKLALPAELEQRLSYLNSGVKNTVSVYQDSENSDSDKVVYDYRSLNWSSSDLQNYFETLTSKRTRATTALVVDAWEKRLSVTNNCWDINAAQETLQQVLQSEFGNDYICSIKNAGTITESGIDLVPSLYVYENNNSEKYLSYLIHVQKLTQSSMFISIYILYTADLIDSSNNYVQNNIADYNRIISIKEKQNPRINNKIEITKQILIEALEKIINSSMEDNIYY